MMLLSFQTESSGFSIHGFTFPLSEASGLPGHSDGVLIFICFPGRGVVMNWPRMGWRRNSEGIFSIPRLGVRAEVGPSRAA